MKGKDGSALIQGISMAAGIALISLLAPRWIGWQDKSIIPSSFLVHTLMLGFSLGVMKLSGRGWSSFGFTKTGYRFSARILLWVIPTALLATAGALSGTRTDAPSPVSGMSPIQIIVFVWGYASVCEEVLTRGLLQTWITMDSAGPGRTRRLSRAIVVSGVFFGAMHLVLIPRMGPAAIGVVVMTTCLGVLAAWYRERTGSLIPSIMVHALFNIGGSLPLWLMIGLK